MQAMQLAVGSTCQHITTCTVAQQHVPYCPQHVLYCPRTCVRAGSTRCPSSTTVAPSPSSVCTQVWQQHTKSEKRASCHAVAHHLHASSLHQNPAPVTRAHTHMRAKTPRHQRRATQATQPTPAGQTSSHDYNPDGNNPEPMTHAHMTTRTKHADMADVSQAAPAHLKGKVGHRQPGGPVQDGTCGHDKQPQQPQPVKVECQAVQHDRIRWPCDKSASQSCRLALAKHAAVVKPSMWLRSQRPRPHSTAQKLKGPESRQPTEGRAQVRHADRLGCGRVVDARVAL